MIFGHQSWGGGQAGDYREACHELWKDLSIHCIIPVIPPHNQSSDDVLNSQNSLMLPKTV